MNIYLIATTLFFQTIKYICEKETNTLIFSNLIRKI